MFKEEMPSIKKEIEKLENTERQQELGELIEKDINDEQVVECKIIDKIYNPEHRGIMSGPVGYVSFPHFSETWELVVEHEGKKGYILVTKEQFDETEIGSSIDAKLNTWEKKNYISDVSKAVETATDFDSLAKVLRSIKRIITANQEYPIDFLIENIEEAIKHNNKAAYSFIPVEYGIAVKVKELAEEYERNR
jgi:hypothetical protein